MTVAPKPIPARDEDDVPGRTLHTPPKPHKEPAKKKPPPKRPPSRKPWG